MIIYQKNLEGKLEKVETNEIKTSYDLKFLISQKLKLETSLDEVNLLISEAENRVKAEEEEEKK